MVGSLWANIEQGLLAGRPVFERFHGESFWDYLAERPKVADEFDASMAEYTREAAGLIANSYDFSRFESIVDLAGGAGELLATILAAHPKLKGVNLDLAHAVRRAPQTFGDRGVADRAQIIEGSVFDQIPTGHDAYLMKNVLHEMLDDAARGPLSKIRQAMAASGKLLIVENVVPEGNGPYLQFLDLIMWLGSGGKERTRAEFTELLASTGFVSVHAPDNPVFAAFLGSSAPGARPRSVDRLREKPCEAVSRPKKMLRKPSSKTLLRPVNGYLASSSSASSRTRRQFL